MTEDDRIARLLTDEKIVFRDAESQAARAHFESMASAPPIEAQASALQLDLLRDLKLINSHIVAASRLSGAGADGRIAAVEARGEYVGGWVKKAAAVSVG